MVVCLGNGRDDITQNIKTKSGLTLKVKAYGRNALGRNSILYLLYIIEMKKTSKWNLFDEYTTEIHIYYWQIKSLEKAKKVAKALEILEEEMWIHTTRLYMKWCFFCPEIDLSKLGDTYMEKHLIDIILQCK